MDARRNGGTEVVASGKEVGNGVWPGGDELTRLRPCVCHPNTSPERKATNHLQGTTPLGPQPASLPPTHPNTDLEQRGLASAVWPDQQAGGAPGQGHRHIMHHRWAVGQRAAICEGTGARQGKGGALAVCDVAVLNALLFRKQSASPHIHARRPAAALTNVRIAEGEAVGGHSNVINSRLLLHRLLLHHRRRRRLLCCCLPCAASVARRWCCLLLCPGAEPGKEATAGGQLRSHLSSQALGLGVGHLYSKE